LGEGKWLSPTRERKSLKRGPEKVGDTSFAGVKNWAAMAMGEEKPGRRAGVGEWQGKVKRVERTGATKRDWRLEVEKK